MSSDNFDLKADDGRIWQNLSASTYFHLSAEAIVVCMELKGLRTSTSFSKYTEYGVTVAGPVNDKHRLEAALFLIRELHWQIHFLESRLDDLEVQSDR